MRRLLWIVIAIGPLMLASPALAQDDASHAADNALIGRTLSLFPVIQLSVNFFTFHK
jgi:hypothetical protein